MKLNPVLPEILFCLLSACTTACEVQMNNDSACQCTVCLSGLVFCIYKFLHGCESHGVSGKLTFLSEESVSS